MTKIPRGPKAETAADRALASKLMDGKPRVELVLSDGTVHARGTVQRYFDHPSFVVELDDGTTKPWSARLTREELPPRPVENLDARLVHAVVDASGGWAQLMGPTASALTRRITLRALLACLEARRRGTLAADDLPLDEVGDLARLEHPDLAVQTESIVDADEVITRATAWACELAELEHLLADPDPDPDETLVDRLRRHLTAVPVVRGTEVRDLPPASWVIECDPDDQPYPAAEPIRAGQAHTTGFGWRVLYRAPGPPPPQVGQVITDDEVLEHLPEHAVVRDNVGRVLQRGDDGPDDWRETGVRPGDTSGPCLPARIIDLDEPS